MSSQMKWKQTDKGSDNDWVNLNQNVNNRLRIDSNLSDVADKSEARKNLGLVGDINTHNHDNRYQTQINGEVNKRQEQDTKLDNRITAEVSKLNAAIEKNNNAASQNWERLESLIKTGDSAERSYAEGQSNTLTRAMAEERSIRDKADVQLQENIDEETKARNDADITEANIRYQNDEQLRSVINGANASLHQEIQNRIEGDKLNDSNLNANVKKINDSLATETDARIKSDDSLRDLLSTLQGNLNATNNRALFGDRVGDKNMFFHWSGQGGQPTWLWGGNDGVNMFVYNPLNFHVSLADNASNAYKLHIESQATETKDLIYNNGIAGSDYFRVRTGGVNDNGWAEIATGNNGNEPIYIRQYDTAGKVAHQVVALDGNGNSSFSGRIYANNGITVNSTLNLANSLWNNIGDDVAIGDCDVAGSFGIKGLNGPTSISLVHRNGTVGNRATITYDGGNLLFNKTLQANLAGNASTSSTSAQLARDGDTRYPMTFHWAGQGGQPTWLWGGNDGTNMYVYNPRNFSVNFANNAASANTASQVSFSGGSMSAGGKDNGDAISNLGSNVTISSWWGIGFYNSCNKRYTISMDLRAGSMRCLGNFSAARVYNAVFNDYAEFFEKGDNAIEAGDILALDMNSEEEKYIKATSDSEVIVGICTEEYAHIIGGKDQSIEENKKEFAPVSLMGRVHVKVTDDVRKGDKIAASDIPGVGRKAKPGEYSVGTALTNPKDGKVRVLVRH